jgi:sugar phosphate permease
MHEKQNETHVEHVVVDEKGLANIETKDAPYISAEEMYPNVNLKRVLLKLDLNILPIVCLLYLLAFLDRGNIGNAKIEGLATNLHLEGNQYNIALAMFFITYSVFEVPSNMMLKRLTPSVWLPLLLVCWGITMTLMGIVRNYGGLLATRILLGAFEAGLFPGVAFYLTLFYRREEMQFRLSLFSSSASVAGAFSGLLAWAIAKMDGIAGLEGWRWIFILEGIATVVGAVFSYFVICDSPAKAWFLSEEEAKFAEHRLRRIQYDSEFHFEETHEVNWKYFKDAVTDPQVYFHVLIYYGVVCPLYGISLFLPTIIKSLGYVSSTAQLMTIPVYVVAAVCSVTVAVISDRVKWRYPFMVGCFTVSIVGYVMAITCNVSTQSNVLYAGMFFCAIGCYSSIPAAVTWMSNNLSGSYKRAVGIAMQIGLASFGGAMASNFYRAQDAPQYKLGHGLEVMFLGLAIISATCVELLYVRWNKKKQRDLDAGVYDTYTMEQISALGDKGPYFKYIL